MKEKGISFISSANYRAKKMSHSLENDDDESILDD